MRLYVHYLIGLALLAAIPISPALSDPGGGTSGGGDPMGGGVSEWVGFIFRHIHQMDTSIYSPKELGLLKKVEDASNEGRLRVIVSDDPLPVEAGNGIVQNGCLKSSWPIGADPTILVYRSCYKVTEPQDQEFLIHHEIAVLAGVEVTGKYDSTHRYMKALAKQLTAKHEKEHQVCAFNVFNRQNQIVGAGTVEMTFDGAKGQIVVVHTMDGKPSYQNPHENNLAALTSIDSSGFLKISLIQANMNVRKAASLPTLQSQDGRPVLVSHKEDVVFDWDKDTAKTLVPETEVYNPYKESADSSLPSKMLAYSNGKLMVSCAWEKNNEDISLQAINSAPVTTAKSTVVSQDRDTATESNHESVRSGNAN